MPTEHPRVQVTLDKQTDRDLSFIAKHKGQSRSAVAADLIREAMELQEDLYFSKLAAERDTPDAVWVSHDEAWK